MTHSSTEAVGGFLVVFAALVLPFALFTYSRSPVPRQIEAGVGQPWTGFVFGAAMLGGIVAVLIAGRLTGTALPAAAALLLGGLALAILTADEEVDP